MGKDGIDPEGDYEVDEKAQLHLADEGFAKAEQLLGVSDRSIRRIPGRTTSPMLKPRSCSSRT